MVPPGLFADSTPHPHGQSDARAEEIRQMTAETTLVLGGTGKTGRRVGERLRRSGKQVRIGSRSAPVPFDWERRETWGLALRNVQSVYVTFQPDLAVPGALETVRAFFSQAIDGGVEKLVLLSGRGEPEAQEAEESLQATHADWTILRASWFNQNFSENFFLDPILAGEVALPRTLAAEPFVDVEDLVDIAVAALNTSAHSRRLYELTGPKAITFADGIDQIARASGRNIAYVPVSMDDYRAELVRQQVPTEYVDLVMYLFGTVLDGRNTPVTGGVEKALGRPARSFADYVQHTAATGIWGDSDARS
jgi:uncharacterized protein YbjT (DUF2867 family)